MDFPNALGNHKLEFLFSLAGTGKNNFLRQAPGTLSKMELAGRSHFQPASIFQEEPQKHRIGIGFDGIADRESGWQGVAKRQEFSLNDSAVIKKQRSSVASHNGRYASVCKNEFASYVAFPVRGCDLRNAHYSPSRLRSDG